MADRRGLLKEIDDVTQREYVMELLLSDLRSIYDGAGIFRDVPDRFLLTNAQITWFFTLVKCTISYDDNVLSFWNKRFGDTDFISLLRVVDREMKTWGIEDCALSVSITKHWTETLVA